MAALPATTRVPTIQELVDLGIDIAGPLRPSLFAIRACVDTWSISAVIDHLPVVRDELEAAGWQHLRDDQLRALLRIFQPIRARLADANRGWMMATIAALATILVAVVGISGVAAKLYGIPGVVVLLVSYRKMKTLEQLFETSKLLCDTASANLDEWAPRG